MKEIRLCWAQTITVVAQSAPVQSTPWEPDASAHRAKLESQVMEGNAADGPDTYWLEERETSAST